MPAKVLTIRCLAAPLGGLVLAACLAAPAVAGATPWQEAMGGAVRLITAGGEPDAGGTYRAALEFRMDPGWKTYWRFPGDSGIGTTADFSTSVNVVSATLAFPAPERHEDPYSTTIGYENGIVLPIAVAVSDREKPATLSVDVSFGLCREVCVPVQAHLQAPLAPDAPEDEQASAAIASAQASVPRPAEAGDALSVVDVTIAKGDEPALRFSARLSAPDAPADLFVEGPEGSYLSVPTLETRDRATAVFALPADGLVADGETADLRLTLVNGGKAVEQAWTLDVSALKP